MKAIVKVLEVKQVKGFIHPLSIYAENPNRYGNKWTTQRYNPIALCVKGVIGGNVVLFYTPTVVVTEVSGFLSYKIMPKNRWFELIEEKPEGVRGAPMFDGGSVPNVCIHTGSRIQPLIAEGQHIEISYMEKEGKIKNVRLLNAY